jgi:AraC family transcriptional regulator of adaptative response / DNA-3-methyladenine glycosylase II
VPGGYRRVLARDGAVAVLEVQAAAGGDALDVVIDTAEAAWREDCLARCAQVFVTVAPIAAISTQLSRDPLLAGCIARCPGLRPPAAWDGFELAVRAVLGQQVTVTAARGLAARLVTQCGTPVPGHGARCRAFPDARAVSRADLSTLGMPRQRRATLGVVAEAVLADPALLDPALALDAAVTRWRALPGVGEWTAQYIALRALRQPDAFPASDVGLLRAAANVRGRPTARDLQARAEAWRPYRGYAAQWLWSAPPAVPEEPDGRETAD